MLPYLLKKILAPQVLQKPLFAFCEDLNLILRNGDIVEELKNEVQSHGYDVTIIGGSGKRRMSHDLTQYINSSIFVVNNYKPNETYRLLLAVDNSAATKKAVKYGIRIAQAFNIEVDVIVQNVAADGTTDLTFTVHRNDIHKAKTITEAVASDLNGRDVAIDENICKVSLVGVGMRSHAGIASQMFKTLADVGINIELITTSEIKISVVIEEKFMELAVRSLHSAFGLDAEAS